MTTSRIILIEDDYSGVCSIHDRYRMLQQHRWDRGGGVLPPLEAWTTTTALARIRGGTASTGTAFLPYEWDGSECLLVDCWDRDAVDGPINSFQSTFFALDVLAAIRDRQETAQRESRDGAVVRLPRIIAYSRAMGDEMVRAALGEFTRRRVEVRIERDGVTLGKRLDVSTDPRASNGVLWAMFDRGTLEDRLDQVVLGDRTGSLEPPPPTSVVWDEFLPNSCLASFHNALRDRYPDVWRCAVLDADRDFRPNGSTRAGVRRLGVKYLEPNPVRGNLTWRGYVEIARRLADPT